MLVLRREEYKAWKRFPPAPRCWIRVWLDGLHSGTHPEWLLSPLSLDVLARLWCLFEQKPDKKDYTKAQRQAVVELAMLYRTDPEAVPVMPTSRDAIPAWRNFFHDHANEHPPHPLQAALDWHRDALLEGLVQPTSADIRRYATGLAAALRLCGLSDRELFLRVNSGVLNVQNLQTVAELERLRGLFDYFQSPRTQRYLCWTPIVSSKELSRTAARQIAPLQISDVVAFDKEGATGFVRISSDVTAPFAITDYTAGHSATAFIYHRRSAQSELIRASEYFPGQLTLAPYSFIVQRGAEAKKPWRYTIESFRPAEELYRPIKKPSRQFANALSRLSDAPELAIKELCDEANSLWDDNWDTLLAAAYWGALRKDLGRRIKIYLVKSNGLWRKHRAEGPGWLNILERGGTSYDLALLAPDLCRAAVGDDDLLVERIRQLADWYRKPPRDRTDEIRHVLVIAKGIRNLLTHTETEAFDIALGPALAYIANVLLHAYCAQVAADNSVSA